MTAEIPSERKESETEREEKTSHPSFFRFLSPVSDSVSRLVFQLTHPFSGSPLRHLSEFVIRGRHGWAPSDTWSLDHYLARVISESVLYLRDHTHGYPAGLSPDQWHDILTAISGPLSVDPDRLLDEEPSEWHERMTREIDAQRKALQLLAEYFPALWD
jgi:hypothetical protein